jgi:MarC family membrane protein
MELMEFGWTQMFSMALALFLLMDPIGNVPIFISALKKVDPARQKLIILRELTIALLIIVLFDFIGKALLDFLNVTLPTIQISGGIILFLIALKMIFPAVWESDAQAALEKEPLVVPLATPLVAGPAVLAAVMLYSGQEQYSTLMTLGAIFTAWIASTLILISSSLWKRMLGSRGLVACERLMGLVLTLIAIQMFLEGVREFTRQCTHV